MGLPALNWIKTRVIFSVRPAFSLCRRNQCSGHVTVPSRGGHCAGNVERLSRRNARTHSQVDVRAGCGVIGNHARLEKHR